jgi:hypothetical protein
MHLGRLTALNMHWFFLFASEHSVGVLEILEDE